MTIKQELRLQKVKELVVQGKNTTEISRELGVSVGTTEKDLRIARDYVKTHGNEFLLGQLACGKLINILIKEGRIKEEKTQHGKAVLEVIQF